MLNDDRDPKRVDNIVKRSWQVSSGANEMNIGGKLSSVCKGMSKPDSKVVKDGDRE